VSVCLNVCVFSACMRVHMRINTGVCASAECFGYLKICI